MEELILENQTAKGVPLRAVFAPSKGMNLLSYRYGDVELIDQSTKEPFLARAAGLGALSGPHFLRRKKETLPKIPDGVSYPHFAENAKRGEVDPFSHGIARYAPWRAKQKGNCITAILSGDEEWEGVPIKDLQGQMFTMRMEASLEEKGLQLDLSVVSDADSVVGIHYYFRLPNGKGKVTSEIAKSSLVDGVEKPLPEDWIDENGLFITDLEEAYDVTLFPRKACGGQILLETDEYRMAIDYEAPSAENSWQLYHPREATFVCIEPLSAKNPHRPNLTVSSVKIGLSILEEST